MDAVATNILEGQTYFQGSCSVDDYLDYFRDLISESGYTSPKTIVVKFRRGLDPKIGDAVATMAANRPDDLDPEGWYEAVVRIDQYQAMNTAFRDSIGAPNADRPLYRERQFSEDKPKISDVVLQPEQEPDVLNIKGMSADNIRCLLQQLSQVDSLPVPPIKTEETHTPALPPNTPLTPRTNRFQGLVVEKTSENTSDWPTIPEATCAKPPRRPKWEWWIPEKLEVGATEPGSNSLYLRVDIESTETHRKQGIRALVDCGATGLFIDREYVKSNQLPQESSLARSQWSM